MLRFLHTSDWHLGQLWREIDRTEEHRLFLDWLVELLKREHRAGRPFHATLVAGDVFDGPNPASRAQSLFYDFLERARHYTRLVITAGNHDSAERLAAPSPLLERLGVSVIGAWPEGTDGLAESLLCPIQGEGEQAIVLAMPFLRVSDLGGIRGDDPTWYVNAHRGRYGELLEHATKKYPLVPILGMGHCYVAGASINLETERRVGNQDQLPADVFSSRLAYVALGHLHRAQRVAGCEHIRYSGSPIPLGYSEVDYAHQIVDVCLEQGQFVSARSIQVPRVRDFLRVPRHHAPWSEVEPLLSQLETIGDRSPSDPLRPLIEVRIQTEASDGATAPRERIEELLDGKWPQLFRIDAKTVGDAAPAFCDDGRALEDLRIEDVFAALCRERNLSEETAPELFADFAELVRSFTDQGGAP